ncbi:NGO1622 family putative holin [Neisseria sp. SLRRB23]|uniref:NGO1622 family putative holin n=1 Tax=Neisseria sp. SLRRB23 TaxID=3435199 RepID=UPI003D7F336B
MKYLIRTALLAVVATGIYACQPQSEAAVQVKAENSLTAMRLAVTDKQAEIDELNAQIDAEIRQREAEELKDYQWIHGDAEVLDGKE